MFNLWYYYMFNWLYNLYNSDPDKNKYDWELLKKLGNIDENIEYKDGFVTTTKTFTSFNGEKTITQVNSISIMEETSQKIKDIDVKIEAAVKVENYELAAELKLERDNLLKK